MNSIVIAILAACAIGSCLGAEDCTQKFTDFHKCLKSSHGSGGADLKAKFEQLKTQVDKCYTDNKCTPPAKGGSSGAGSSGESSGEKTGAHAQCFKDLMAAKKTKLEDCMKGKGVTLPANKGGEEHDGKGWGGKGGFRGHKDENKALDGCAAKQAVRDCKKKVFESAQPSEDQKKKAFDDKCAAKNKCKAALGAACQQQLDAFKAAATACHESLQSQKDSLRASTPSCAGVTPRPSRGGSSGEKKKSGDKTDYCAQGYAAFAAAHQKKGGH